MSALARSYEPIEFSPDEVSTYCGYRLPEMPQRGREWRWRCPVHGGEGLNFAVNSDTGYAYCFSQCGKGWDIIGLEMALSNADFRSAKAEVYRIVSRVEHTSRRIVAEYDYTDEQGNVLYQVVRFDPKDFRQRRPDGHGGWIWKKSDTQVLYRLPEVIDAPIVFLVEGERDVEVMRSMGFVATTVAGGSKTPWLQSFTDALRGREVIVIPDNDEPGVKCAYNRARALRGNVARLRVHRVDGAKDIGEWFERGHSETEFVHRLECGEVCQ